MTRSLAIAAIAVTAVSTLASGELVLTQRQAYVMGTRVDLTAFGADRTRGFEALDRALATLEATDRELSTWKPDSEVSTLNGLALGASHALQPRLCSLLPELDEWRAATGGAFDAGIGTLTDAWGVHAGGRVPTPRELEMARARSGLRFFEIDRARCRVTRRGQARIDVGAFGKGEALDRAARVLNGLPWMIDFGGQVSVGGVPPGRSAWTVRLADPRHRERSLMTVQMRSGSISTSAGSERDVFVRGERIGHILDPRTGTPAPYGGSVAVWHERGLVADILSTALYVMGPRDGVSWAEARGIAAVFLIPERGRIETVATAAFGRLEPAIELCCRGGSW